MKFAVNLVNHHHVATILRHSRPGIVCTFIGQAVSLAGGERVAIDLRPTPSIRGK